MSVLEQCRAKLLEACTAHSVGPDQAVTVRPLSPDEAIGTKADSQFVIKKGRERVIEARLRDHRGQAFTDAPTNFNGALREVLALGLQETPNRAVFVATMNALLRSLGMANGTIHCWDEDPGRCGPEIARTVEDGYGRVRVGLIGLQPAILKALTERFGCDHVRVLDLNAENTGSTKCGVPVWDGAVGLPRLVERCDVGLATGSSVVNGTIDGIIRSFEEAGKPLVFFGNTISGVAALLGLNRIYPFGR